MDSRVDRFIIDPEFSMSDKQLYDKLTRYETQTVREKKRKDRKECVFCSSRNIFNICNI